MARVKFVADSDDSELDDFRDLSIADRRPDRPGGRGLVIAEGAVVVRRLLRSPYPIRALLGVKRRIGELEPDLAGVDVPVYMASADTMARVVGFHLNRGVLAVADRVPSVAPERLVHEARMLLVLEGVGDHENVGSLFRNAAALGVDGVFLGAGCADPLYRRSVRVSMGHVLGVPFATLEEWPSGLRWMRRNGVRTIALTPRANAPTLREVRAFEMEGPVALVLGSEGHGLTEEALASADALARIPMGRHVDSLNVATAAAIACYELGNPR